MCTHIYYLRHKQYELCLACLLDKNLESRVCKSVITVTFISNKIYLLEPYLMHWLNFEKVQSKN